MPAIIAAVAPAVIGGISSAAGGSGGVTGATLPPNVNTSYNQQTTLPDWYNNEQQGLLTDINDSAGYAQSLENPNVAAPVNAAAATALEGASNPNAIAGNIDSYLDPFMANAVSGIENASNTNLMTNILPGVNNTFTGAGQFGSNRNADFESQAIYQNQQAADQAIALAEETGYGQALSGAETGGQQAIAAGEGLCQLGETQTTEVGQGITQALAPATAQAQVVNGMQVPTSINGTGNAPLPGATYGPSIASQLAGGVAAGLAAANSPSNTTPSTSNNLSAGDANAVAGATGIYKRGGLAKTKKRRGGALSQCAA